MKSELTPFQISFLREEAGTYTPDDESAKSLESSGLIESTVTKSGLHDWAITEKGRNAVSVK